LLLRANVRKWRILLKNSENGRRRKSPQCTLSLTGVVESDRTAVADAARSIVKEQGAPPTYFFGRPAQVPEKFGSFARTDFFNNIGATQKSRHVRDLVAVRCKADIK
jgi:hypothetical protein